MKKIVFRFVLIFGVFSSESLVADECGSMESMAAAYVPMVLRLCELEEDKSVRQHVIKRLSFDLFIFWHSNRDKLSKTDSAIFNMIRHTYHVSIDPKVRYSALLKSSMQDPLDILDVDDNEIADYMMFDNKDNYLLMVKKFIEFAK